MELMHAANMDYLRRDLIATKTETKCLLATQTGPFA